MLADILPQSLLSEQPTGLLWLIVLASIGLLVFGANQTVSSAVRLARALGVSKVIVGATIVSLGTTTPETCVSVAAAFQGNPGLSLGNAVGSILADTGLIFGLCCVIKRLPMDRFVVKRHGWLQLGAGVLLVATCLGLWALSGDIHDVVIPRSVGFLYVLLLVGYLYLSVKWARLHPQLIPEEAKGANGTSRRGGAFLRNIALLVTGLAVVVLTSDSLVGSVEVICQRSNIPESVLAITLVAVGTSLPELAIALGSLIKGHEDLSVGNILGADILNVLYVSGASAVASPLRVEPAFFYLYLPSMIAVLVLFRLYTLLGRDRFHRWQGVPLLAAYAIFVVLTLVLARS
jgi:cation:H+ antiporter